MRSESLRLILVHTTRDIAGVKFQIIVCILNSTPIHENLEVELLGPCRVCNGSTLQHVEFSTVRWMEKLPVAAVRRFVAGYTQSSSVHTHRMFCVRILGIRKIKLRIYSHVICRNVVQMIQRMLRNCACGLR